jgi:hypothetical protein
MSALPACAAPIGVARLFDYWLDEVDAAAEEAVGRHLLECAHCSGELERLLDVGDHVRSLMRSGRVRAVLGEAFVQRLTDAGVRVREYRMAPGGSVDCSVAPEDDLLVARLQAPLADVGRLDVVVVNAMGDGSTRRLTDVPFDPDAAEILMAPVTAAVRQAPAHVQQVRLIAVEPTAERVLGEYVFRHTPWPGAERSTAD